MRGKAYRRKAAVQARRKLRHSGWFWVFRALDNEQAWLPPKMDRKSLQRYVGKIVSCHGCLSRDTWNKGEARRTREQALGKAEIDEVADIVCCPVSL